MSFILVDGIKLLRDTLPLPNCVLITQGNQMSEKNGFTCLHLHPHITLLPPPPSPPSAINNSPGHYLIPWPQHSRWSNHLNNRWRSQTTSPVVLFLSSPVSLIIAKSSFPPSLSLREKSNMSAEPWMNRNVTAAVAVGSWRDLASIWIHKILQQGVFLPTSGSNKFVLSQLEASVAICWHCWLPPYCVNNPVQIVESLDHGCLFTIHYFCTLFCSYDSWQPQSGLCIYAGVTSTLFKAYTQIVCALSLNQHISILTRKMSYHDYLTTSCVLLWQCKSICVH